MKVLSESRYWVFAFIIGTFIQGLLFGMMPLLGTKPQMTVSADYITIDFLEWRPPKPTPVKPNIKRPEPKPIKKKPDRPKPKPKQILEPKPKQAAEKPSARPVLSEQAQDTTLHDSPPVTEEALSEPEPPAPQVQDSSAEPSPEILPTPVPIFKVSAMPRYAHQAPGHYPPEMRALGLEGVVHLEVLIDKNGRVRKVTVTKSLGDAFDRAAVEKLRQSSFIPAHVNGKPVPVIIREKVQFQLK